MNTWSCSSEIYDELYQYLIQNNDNFDRVTIISIIENTIRKHISNY